MKKRILAGILAAACAVSISSITVLADSVSPDKFEAESYSEWYDATAEDIADTDFLPLLQETTLRSKTAEQVNR